MRLLRLALLSTVFLATALVAAAQSVRWENGDSPLGNVVQLIFENCEPDGDPQLPKIENATLAFAGSATSVNMVNFNVTRTQVLSYLVQGRRGPLQIPEFTVKTNKGPIKVAAFNGAAPAISADSVATARLIPERTTVWAGEIFALNYKLTAARRNNPQFDSFVFDWNPAPLLTEEWSKPAATETVVDGQRQIVIDVSTRAYAKAAGAFKLEAAQQIVHVQTGAVGFGLFSQPRMEPVSVTSDQPTIEVRPLPAPPGQFSGAVGQFKLSSKVVPREAAVGEPVTWTLELSGTGNWPDIAGLPARDVSRDFQVVQPKAKRVNADGKLFDATLTEDVVLVPTKAGRYALGPVSFTYFNPKTGNYETVSTERVTVTINPAATAAPAPAAPEPAVGDTEPAAQTERRPQPKAPEAPAAIPRDPLRGSDTAAGPLTWRTTLLWVALPFALLVGYWLALAWRRALRTDPLRPQREAHQRLTALLTSMQSADPTRVGADTLLQWQRDVATLWQVNHAAPTAAQIEAAAQRARSAQAAAWARLWQDSEAGLYQARPSLPPDWVARAEAALEASPPRRFNPARLFLPRNLLAFAAVLAGVTILLPQRADAAAATSPEVAYNAGEFAQAETAWRQALTQNPRDWIARHNLALALAQQDRPGEAAAHAVVAFVQQPSDPSVR